MPSAIAISVVLPALNEAANIEHTIQAVMNYMSDRHDSYEIDYEIIVVNDGSTDATADILTGLSQTNHRLQVVTHSKNLGYGSALRSGFDLASFEYIFLMDSDRQFDIADLDRFLPQLEINKELILIGYRQKRADPIMRSLNAKAYHLFIQVLFGLSVKDMDCAFKLFPRRAYLDIQPVKANGALFSGELLIKWQLAGFKRIEIPVRHFPRRFGVQTGANLGVILKMFKECWQLKQNLHSETKNSVSRNSLNPIEACHTIGHKPHPLIKP